MCLACRIRPGPLCSSCRLELRSVPPTATNGVPTQAAFLHHGAATALVHRLKYDASRAAGALLSTAMTALVPSHARCLVPIPRSYVRRFRYGIDAAATLADELASTTGLPVVDALARPLWHPRHAGVSRARRRRHEFIPKRPAPGCVVVDDVMTTGATVASALHALPGAVGVVTATRSGGTSLLMRAPQP